MPPGLFGHIMPYFRHNILGIGIMWDKDSKFLFTRRSVIIYDKNKNLFLTGWREIDGGKLWRITLKPDLANAQPCPGDPEDPDNIQEEATLGSFSTYDLPYVDELVKYFHASDGYLVQYICLKAINAGNYESFPGKTYNNSAKYCPSSDETIKVHMVHTRHNFCSPKPNNKKSGADRIKKITGAGYGTKRAMATEESPEMEEPEPGNDSVNELHVNIIHQIKLYTDDTMQFPTRASSGNQYIMVAYHSYNVILVEPIASRKDKHRLAAYNIIMQELKDKNPLVNLQIIGNKFSKEYKATMKENWGVNYQLVLPDIHS